MTDSDMLDLMRDCLPMLAVERILNLGHLLMQTRDVRGANVEFGVFQGHTALLMRHLSPHQALWLYDSFEGWPEPEPGDTTNPVSFFKGAMKASPDDVKALFLKHGRYLPHIVPGRFEALSSDALPPHIAFAHIDCDLRRSIFAALELVWPRMAIGGICLIDDVGHPELPGAAKAASEFFYGRLGSELIQLKGMRGDAWHAYAVRH